MSRVVIVRSRAATPSVDRFASSVARMGNQVAVLRWDRTARIANGDSPNPKLVYFRLAAPYDQLHVAFVQPFWQLYLLFTLIRADVDIVHACDLDTLFPALVACRIRRKRLFYTIYDFYADNLPPRVPTLIRKTVAALERAGARMADWLFLVNERQIQQLGPSVKPSTSVIYNTPSDRRLASREPLDPSERENPPLLLFYAGNLHESRGLWSILQAIDQLPKCELEIAGRGPEEARLLEIARRLDGRVRFLGWIPHEAVVSHSLRADIIFGFYDPRIANNRYASPNKLFEAMMCEKPFLTNSGTYASEVVARERCGIVVPYGDVTALREAIASLEKNPAYRGELGRRGRDAYDARYSWAEMERRIAEAYGADLRDKSRNRGS